MIIVLYVMNVVNGQAIIKRRFGCFIFIHWIHFGEKYNQYISRNANVKDNILLKIIEISIGINSLAMCVNKITVKKQRICSFFENMG